MNGENSSSLYVGIGASAGGIKACKELLQSLPSTTNNSYIIVLHLKPDVESRLASIFQGVTSMPVVEVTKNESLRPNYVYVISPNTLLEIEGNTLIPREMPKNEEHYLQRPINKLFKSLARNKFERSVGVILSGTGDDGTVGSYEIKYNMGEVIVQTPSTAEFNEMPTNVISSGNVDKELEIAQIPLFLENYAKLLPLRKSSKSITINISSDKTSENALKKIFELLSDRYHIDLKNFYKQGTLLRRSARRMQLININTLSEYTQYLENHLDESEALYNDLLIGVTKFFRDLHVWKDLEEVTIPKLIQSHKYESAFRVWVPGCATGEEAYSLAIIINEQLKREKRNIPVQIFATDISESSLNFARQATYSKNIERAIPFDTLNSYFEKLGDHYRVKREIRELVTFSHHNLLTDPPFTTMDLISCRNLLIYFQPEAQQRVMELFHFALRPTGFLLLGTAETTGQKNNLFEIESGINKIYRPIISKRMRYQHLKNFSIQASGNAMIYKGINFGQRPEKSIDQYVEKFVLTKHTHSCVAISESFEIYSFYGDTRNFLTPPVGEAKMSILAWAKSEIYAKLRSALEEAKNKNEKVEVSGIQINSSGNKEFVELTIEPISPLPNNLRMFLVTFKLNKSHYKLLHGPIANSLEIPVEKTDYVKQLESELKNTQDELENTVSQFKTSLDEYQANHEELVTLNEELQSNNEEIEASKEELQSLIEELSALNQQNKSKNEELQEVLNDLNNLLISTNIPIIFLDRNHCVRRFTPSIKDIFHITKSDIGRPIQEIKEKFNGDNLITDIQKVSASDRLVKREVHCDDGRFFNVVILPYKDEDGKIDGTCISFNDISLQKQAFLELDEQKNFSEITIDTTFTGLVLLDNDFTVVMANQAFCDFLRVTKNQIYHDNFFKLKNGILNTSEFRALADKILNSKITKKTSIVKSTLRNIGPKKFRITSRKITLRGKEKIILAIQDITIQRDSKRILQKRTAALKQEQKRKDEFLAMLSHELRNPLNAIINGVTLLEIKSKSKEDEKSMSIIEMMKRQSGRIVSILDELLEITRISTGKIQLTLEPVNFVEAINDAIEALGHAIKEKNHQLSLNYSPSDQYMVYADKTRLVQIAENLINNAIKYTPNGGQIRIILEKDQYYTRLIVQDNGIGIEPELIDKVFDIFVQGKNDSNPSQKGVGLGLSLIQNLVEAHKGTISAHSEGPGKGSEFIVELKSYVTKAPGDKANKGTYPKNTSIKKKILIIDDEEDSAKMLADILKNAGFKTHYSINETEALEVFKNFMPDITIIDMALPTMDGYELEKKIHENFPQHYSLMIALSGLKKDSERFKKSGFHHYMLKPAKINELIKIIVND